MRKLLFVACVSFVGMTVAHDARADITGTHGETYAEVWEDSSGNYDYIYSTILAGDSVTATISGFSSFHTSSYFSTGATNSFDYFRQGGLYDYAYAYGTMEFTTNANDSYSTSGTFTNSDGFTHLEAYFYDYDLGDYLFYSIQSDSRVGGTTLTLGNVAGNLSNFLQGSPTGFLTAGNQYQWHVFTFTQAYPNADGGATASGSASLLIGSVPEPSSVALLGFAAVGIVLYRRRRKQ